MRFIYQISHTRINMSLYVYNTKTRTKEKFVSIIPGQVSMYVCGPTVYGYPHVGHAKCYVTFDVIRRYLEYSGYKVKYVQNITDVGHLVGDGDEGEDKIQRKSILEQLDPVQVAYQYECSYFNCMDKMNVLRPSISCRATGYIMEIEEMIQNLIDKGFAYITDAGNVYYDVFKYPKYGALSGRTIGNGLSGERIEIAGDKHHSEDFALWKAADSTHLMKWNSPWSVGYPGWHMECSVMSKKFLGATLDIHGGGMDNIFPHHECECAQSEIANGTTFVNYFLHNNLVTVNGKKMGKSLGNFVTLPELFLKIDPIVARYYILLNHYRSPTDFDEKNIAQASIQYNEMSQIISIARNVIGDVLITEPVNEIVLMKKREILDSMDNDFNTALVISYLLSYTKELKSELAKEQLDISLISDYIWLFDKCASPILGIPFESDCVSNREINKYEVLVDSLINMLLDMRKEKKQQKDYIGADNIRNQLIAIGVEVQDGREGSTYVIKE